MAQTSNLGDHRGQVASLPACLNDSQVISSSPDYFFCPPRRTDDEPLVVLQTRALTGRPQSQHARGELPGEYGREGIGGRGRSCGTKEHGVGRPSRTVKSLSPWTPQTCLSFSLFSQHCPILPFKGMVAFPLRGAAGREIPQGHARMGARGCVLVAPGKGRWSCTSSPFCCCPGREREERKGLELPGHSTGQRVRRGSAGGYGHSAPSRGSFVLHCPCWTCHFMGEMSTTYLLLP